MRGHLPHRSWQPAKTLAWLVLGLLAGCRSAEPPVRFQWHAEDWQFDSASGKRLVTDHYEIFTTVRDERFLELMPTVLESAYRRYVKLFPSARPTDARMTSYVFLTRDHWLRFTRTFAPARLRVYSHIHAGGYQERGVAVLHYIGRHSTLSVLAHEGLHQFVETHLPERIPAWLNEGLACYCEALEFRNGRCIFTPQHNIHRLNYLREALTGDRLIPLAKLLSTDAGEAVVKPEVPVRTYYAQVWALIVFLRHGAGGKYVPGFVRMLADAGTPQMRIGARAYIAATPTPDRKPLSFGQAVFRRYITEDTDAFNAEFTQYLRHLSGLAPGGA